MTDMSSDILGPKWSSITVAVEKSMRLLPCGTQVSWFFTDLVLVKIASTRSCVEGVMSAGRTALLANQNPDHILAARLPISSQH